MTRYTVYYYAGTYYGEMEVVAEDEDQAIATVRARVRKSIYLPIYADGYRVVKVEAG